MIVLSRAFNPVPRLAECEARGGCLCRSAYRETAGYFTVGPDGHADSYYRDRRDALRALARRAARTASGPIPPDLAADLIRDAIA